MESLAGLPVCPAERDAARHRRRATRHGHRPGPSPLEAGELLCSSLYLMIPTAEGGDLIFAHVSGLGVRVWARALALRVDETSHSGRRAAPLYGGGISHAGWAQVEEFFAACAEADDPASPVALTAPRIVDARPIKVRSGHGPADKTTTAFFNASAVSPLHTTGS